MSISEDIKALEDALEAGPTEGPWRLTVHDLVEHWPAFDAVRNDWTLARGGLAVVASEDGFRNWQDVRLFAACSPDRIRRVLDRLALLEDEERDIVRAANSVDATERENAKLSARLSKAIDLLLKAAGEGAAGEVLSLETLQRVNAFLKEVSE